MFEIVHRMPFGLCLTDLLMRRSVSLAARAVVSLLS